MLTINLAALAYDKASDCVTAQYATGEHMPWRMWHVGEPFPYETLHARRVAQILVDGHELAWLEQAIRLREQYPDPYTNPPEGQKL